MKKDGSIACPYCGCQSNDVTRTMRIKVQGVTHIRRYRKCDNPKCDFSFRTKEVLDEDTGSKKN